MYPILRDILFRFDPEKVHYFSMNALRAANSIGFMNHLIRQQFTYQGESLHKTVFGLNFTNPVGLGAGFDKNALYLPELAALGFGFVETGTITPKAQAGNDKPRLFRLSADKALINRMGFNNDGLSQIKERLIQYRLQQEGVSNRMIVGANIGKNKLTPNEEAVKDYCICFETLHQCADYFVVNVSSPNTPALRELQEKQALLKIFDGLNNINAAQKKPKPLLLKIAPDLSQAQLDDIISLAFEMNLSGLVATNTTLDRSNLSATSTSQVTAIGMGGLSGKPVTARATEVVQYLARQTDYKIPIIASGGIFTGADAKEKMDAGAALVQVWTGFVYEGPSIVKNICNYIAAN
ncbi:MAG: quinone-dependent dihydroorotate dehydrogenase [Sediminibacterium sp.]|nr:quinone-dependent dihydroorotate dehydrogenase [Sediminibacterium sp.]MCA6441000.1 quinone-dependent dihydroorotate dehydrogenase [Chitinophagaceae bacterium]MCA6447443.1 quinone-dependent dihydroorotate dehydrogenase [Chitinophagaceae bacterium]